MVTGWKITGFSDGTQGHFVKNVIDYSGTTHDEDEYPPYNFADRYCTDKDKYAVSGRVFSQGAYYDVPEGVTGITIEPYWGTAVYLSDPTYDVAYPYGYGDKNVNAVFVSNMGSRYVGGNTASINDDNQIVYTDYASAFGQVGSGNVYDNAIVLVGNYHHYWGQNSPSTTKAFTIMSADLNNDCEPDYSFIVQHGTNRQDISAIRFDFINSPGLGMIQKVETDKAVPKHGIWYPKGWFEVTNTTLIQFTQFEYDNGGKSAGSPLILLGGIYDQFVTSRYKVANSTEYIHLGSNIWMKEFCNGTHTANANTSTTRHVPISVTGGEFESFYLTGTFQPNVESVTDNAECYINGGKFGDMAGAGQEQLKGDVTWLIDHADITNFYGGGINDQKPVLGNIYVEINNSNVGLYCGGPKFGNMQDNMKVTTKAKGSTFGNFYGAGYGGTSYYRDMTKDKTGEKDWNTWVGDYTRKYVAGRGISTEYECEFIPYSGGESGQADYVGRLYVLYASLSLAKTKNVESTLEDCHITGSFYGGGKLGSVDGNITSTLKNCTVDENVFGAGFSASVEKVNVVPKGALMKANPAYNESVGVFTDGVYPDGVPYTWTQAASVSAGHEFDDTNHLIYTTTDLTSLGAVTGKAKLTINGGIVEGSVFGGGDMSKSSGDTEVNIQDGTIVNNVFGGGNLADVGGSVTVNVTGGTINHDVYGGGALANTNNFDPNQYEIVEGVVANVTIVTGLYTKSGETYSEITNANQKASANTDYYKKGKWVTTLTNNTTTVNLYGGTINGDAYGGGLGQIGREANPDLNAEAIEDIPAMVKGDVTVTLNGSKLHNTKDKDDQNNDISVSGRIFGCNNLNGWPLGSVTVQVEKTVPDSGNKHQQGTYEVAAVYGGGNLAMYKPTDLTNGTTNVIINGCDYTSIEQVYGGGNAASTPATQVTINGTYEINEVFGGGNGKDRIQKNGQWMDNPGANVGYYEYADNATDAQTPSAREENYQYGSGEAQVNINGGRIHSVYGGSNTKGNVRKTAVAMLEELKESDGTAMCSLNVDEAYGGGKSAPMDGEAKLEMKCIPGLKAAYGGAENADIRNNVTLNITNGTFEQVFGGNNLGGRIDGSITVNIEETGCRPVIIGELYGGGNRAAYSVYGYKQVTEGEGENAVTTWQPRVSNNDDGDQPNNKYADPTVNIRSFSSIGSVYGGGYGSSAVMVGDPHVDINVVEGQPDTYPASGTTFGSLGTFSSTGYSGVTKEIDGDIVTIPPHKPGELGVINNVFGGGNQAMVIGDTYVNIGTSEKINFQTKTKSQDSPQQNVTVKGANIVGNVYGGGNAADVTGKTNVTIGKKGKKDE